VGGFKREYDFEKRTEVAKKIRIKFPDRVPVILERTANSSLPPCTKRKFLLPQDLQLSKFVIEIRKHMEDHDQKKAIFLFVNDNLPQTSAMVSEIYEKYQDEDGFLYLTYSGENTFGNSA